MFEPVGEIFLLPSGLAKGIEPYLLSRYAEGAPSVRFDVDRIQSGGLKKSERGCDYAVMVVIPCPSKVLAKYDIPFRFIL